jgi:hypothetical protein
MSGGPDVVVIIRKRNLEKGTSGPGKNPQEISGSRASVVFLCKF